MAHGLVTTLRRSRVELIAWASDHVGFVGLDLHRISTVLLSQLQSLEGRGIISVFSVTDEIQYLEGVRQATATAPMAPFRKGVLKGLHKKHFTDARFVIGNVAAQFDLLRDGNARLTETVNKVLREPSADLAAQLGNALTVEAYEDRARRRHLTGEWVVIKRYGGLNYYLAIAAHVEGDSPILERARLACETDAYPFTLVSAAPTDAQ